VICGKRLLFPAACGGLCTSRVHDPGPGAAIELDASRTILAAND